MDETFAGKGNCQKIYKAIADALAEVKSVEKTNQNKQQNFLYRSIDDVMNEMHGIFAKFKIFTIPEVLEIVETEKPTRDGKLLFYTTAKIKYTFFTEDGSSVSCVVVGKAMDYGDKSCSKAMSIAFKYAVLQIFCIPTDEEKDPDANSYEVMQQKVETKLAKNPISENLQRAMVDALETYRATLQKMVKEQRMDENAAREKFGFANNLKTTAKAKDASAYEQAIAEIHKLNDDLLLEFVPF